MQHYSVPFSGGDPCEFVRGYEEFFKVNPMTEIDMIQYVMQDFEGEALEWYYQYVEGKFLDTWTPDCWKDFVIELYGRFLGEHHVFVEMPETNQNQLKMQQGGDSFAFETGDHKDLMDREDGVRKDSQATMSEPNYAIVAIEDSLKHAIKQSPFGDGVSAKEAQIQITERTFESDDYRVIIWDWQFGSMKLSFHSCHNGNVFQAKFMPYSKDKNIVTRASDGQVRHAKILEHGQMETKLLAKHQQQVHNFAIELGSPHMFYTCGEDGMVQHFDLRTGAATELFTCKPVSDIPMPIARLNAIEIDLRNPNMLAVAGSDEYTRLYDIRKYKWDGSTNFGQSADHFCPQHLIGLRDELIEITGLAFSEHGKLLTSYNDEFIYPKDMGLGPDPNFAFPVYMDSDVNEMKSDHCLVESSSDRNSDTIVAPQVYKGHKNCETVKGVNFFGPNCEYVVSGLDCGRIFIWKKKGGELIRVMEADKQVTNCIESHPHTTVLANSGIENDIKIWTQKATERTTLPTNIEKVLLHGPIRLIPISDMDEENEYLFDFMNEIMWTPSVHSVLNTCQGESSTPFPLCDFIALSDSIGCSWIVGMTSSHECVVLEMETLEMETWNLLLPIDVNKENKSTSSEFTQNLLIRKRNQQVARMVPLISRASLSGIYTESKENNGERVMCLLGDTMMPARYSDPADPWEWVKAYGYTNQPPLLQDDQVLLILRYPRKINLTSKAIHNRMKSLNLKSNSKYSDEVCISFWLGTSADYEFGSKKLVSKACSPLFGRYWSSRNGSRTKDEVPYHAKVEYTEKQLLLNVSAQLGLSGQQYNNFSMLFLERLYNPSVGKMYLIGCRDVRASWKILFERMDLEAGLDCLVEVIVTFSPATTRWLVNPNARIFISSKRNEDEPLYFSPVKLQTLPIMYMRQQEDLFSHQGVEGVLHILTLSVAVACVLSQLFYIRDNAESVPYIYLVMLCVKVYLGISASNTPKYWLVLSATNIQISILEDKELFNFKQWGIVKRWEQGITEPLEEEYSSIRKRSVSYYQIRALKLQRSN